MTTQGWKVRRPSIVDESIDDEVIVLDTTTGNYFSCEGPAAVVWSCLSDGCEEKALIHAIGDASGIPEDEVRETLRPFLEELAENRLIEKSHVSFPPPTIVLQTVFTPPVLNRYTDMKDFLLLDPIHEVDDSGWPRPSK